MNQSIKSLLSTFLALSLSAYAQAVDPVDFQREIRPLLSDKCYYCHGPDDENREAELRLDVESSAHEFVIVPGKPEKSELITRITTDYSDEKMPPPKSGKSLTEADIEKIRQWINEGGKYEKHWSFQPPERPTPPKTSNRGWIKNPIDNFVLSKLEEEGLQPSKPTDKTTLIRRVTLDLTGVPPTREETQAFLADKSSKAYENLVDRLLESERYGERMAVTWLDAARYADTMGYQADWERTQWPWRTWVIDAYNHNVPFDQFTIEQLAGDLLPDPSVDQLVATGFNRNHRINDEGGIVPEEYLVEYHVDRVETTAGTWLGMTFGCARCHDHKFDPLSQKDFYKFLGFFNGVPENGKDGRKGFATPYLRVAVRGKQTEYEKLVDLVDSLSKQFNQSIPKLESALDSWVQKKETELTNGSLAWSIDEPRNITSGDAVEFEVLDDRSALSFLRAFGVGNPTFKVNISPGVKTVKAIRLETLLHENLPGGLTLNDGNFILTEFSVDLRRKGEKPITLELASAEADYEQAGYPVANAIDGKPKTGWAVDGHIKKEDRVAVFTFAEPVNINQGDILQVSLAHKSEEPEHAIGRFRLSTTDQEQASLSIDSGLPSDVLKTLHTKAADRTSKEQTVLTLYHASVAPEIAPIREKLKEAKNKLDKFEDAFTTNVMVMEEMTELRPTHVLERGLYNKPGEQVTADVPGEMLGALPPNALKNRLGLAQWLVSGNHPLTARVMMNRYWSMFFGSGLVETIEDFGLQGAYPSHPKLLDWLATEYPRSGWNTKEMVKLIVTSATYRQSSDVTPEMVERDPTNRLLARMTRFRLPAEMIRDQALFTSNLLVEKIGGPSVKPYQPEGLWEELSFQSKNRTTDYYVQGTGEDLYRRSMYTFWKRTVPPPTMATFDAPSREMCILDRPKTNTPLQALALMNDPTFVEAARVLAEYTMRAADDSRKQLTIAFQTILTRTPSDFELQLLHDGFQKRLGYFKQEPQDAASMIAVGNTAPDQELDPSYLAALSTSVMNLFNLDETIHHE